MTTRQRTPGIPSEPLFIGNTNLVSYSLALANRGYSPEFDINTVVSGPALQYDIVKKRVTVVPDANSLGLYATDIKTKRANVTAHRSGLPGEKIFRVTLSEAHTLQQKAIAESNKPKHR